MKPRGRRDFSDEPRQAKPPKLSVLHQDESLIVVDKPPGMPVGHGWFEGPGVVEQLVACGYGEDTLSPLVALEPDVSGIMVFAIGDTCRSALQDQFENDSLSLTFVALVRAAVRDESGRIERAVHTLKLSTNDRRETGQVSLEWKLRDKFVGFSLLECVPKTLVPAQVRALLEAAGTPLAVDRHYGGADELMLSSFKAGYRPSRRRPERPLIQRPSIHAASITLQHPETGESLTFTADLPKDLRATLHQLDRFGRVARRDPER